MHKGMKYLAIALVCLGVVLGWFAYMAMFQRAQSPKAVNVGASGNVVPALRHVVVIRSAVAAGQILSDADVELAEVSQASPQALEQVNLAIGRVVAQAMVAGDVVTANSLLTGLVGRIAIGERAVAIKVEESSAVGHKIQPGDWVDVLVILRREGDEVAQTQARSLLARRQVLAYGDQVDIEKTPHTDPPGSTTSISAMVSGNQRANAKERSNVARTAVLLVRAEEVNQLLLAERQGQVLLTLRNPLEQVWGQDGGSKTIDRAPHMNESFESKDVLTLHELSKTLASELPALGASTRVQASPSAALKQLSKGRSHQNGTVNRGRSVELIRGVHSETIHY